jgi:hypothetical protein
MGAQIEQENASILNILTSENARVVNGFCVSVTRPRSATVDTEVDVPPIDSARSEMRSHIQTRYALVTLCLDAFWLKLSVFDAELLSISRGL